MSNAAKNFDFLTTECST